MSALGAPPMPWQRYGAGLIGARRDDGRPVFSTIVISVPRQSGKSRMMMGVALNRVLSQTDARVWYTAQTGTDAADQWRECLDTVLKSPVRPLFDFRRANGAQCLWSPQTGGRFSPHPPTEEKLHGKQSDLNILDEAWAFDEIQAEALMGAIVPTQATRPNAQTIIVSTMGTARSAWFHGMCDRARSGEPGMAILEYGIGPDDDPNDLDVIAAHHPAYGYTIDMESIRAASAQLSPAEFARAYGNRATGAVERLIPADRWNAAISPELIPVDARVCVGAAVDIDRTQTAIAAAWVDPYGVPYVEVIDVRPGTAWAPSALRSILDHNDVAALVVDQVGPSGSLHDTLARDGVDVSPITPRELTATCGEIYDRVMSTPPRIHILDDPALNLAAEIVTKRHLGDAWAWSRRGSSGSIAALEAATLALHGALHVKPPAAKPFVYL